MEAYDFYKHPAWKQAWDRLVPPDGRCETQEGEILRAMSRIYHDYVNNGFGNNWSGALNYLDTYLGVPKPIREVLAPYARGRVRRSGKDDFTENDQVLVALETLGERVNVCMVRCLEEGFTFTPNPCDMFDLSDKDDWGGDEEEDC